MGQKTYVKLRENLNLTVIFTSQNLKSYTAKSPAKQNTESWKWSYFSQADEKIVIWLRNDVKGIYCYEIMNI